MSTLTPMMQQYKKIKAEHDHAILFFRLGDFYEMFYEDAKKASEILGITLTAREAGKGNTVPMCGIPFHAADSYIMKLIHAGCKVSICEQVETPTEAKGVVKREVVRTVTPGTVLETQLIRESLSQYVASIAQTDQCYGLSLLDVSTGEFKVIELDQFEDVLSELIRTQPAECLLSQKLNQTGHPIESALSHELPQMVRTEIDDWKYEIDACEKTLLQHFHTQSLDGFGCRDLISGVMAAAMALGYVKDVIQSPVDHIRKLTVYSNQDYVLIDKTTQRNLELLETIRPTEKGKGTLNWVLDQTRTSMGARRLRQWIVQPLVDREQILQRQDAIEEMVELGVGLEKIREILSQVKDLERLVGRVHCDLANARDLLALKCSLHQIPHLKEHLSAFRSDLLQAMNAQMIPMDEVIGLIEQSIADDPPLILREGGFIKKGYSPELDEIKEISRGGKEWISNLQKQEIERTGIKSLKVGYNKVFGYYLEVTNSHLTKIPENYIRKQTISNAERFITEELKEKEAKVLGAQEKSHQLEYDLFLQIRKLVKNHTSVIQQIAESIATADILVGLSLVALQNEYVRPDIREDEQIMIEDGRHPVLEKILIGERFIANDTLLDCEENQILIITGPNMAGKSTYLRQVALIVIMAQMGGFVPAQKARIGLVDKIFSRIGASDELVRGQSTFMVEMNETANILNHATSKSLVILDEIGRGTSTFDGISIAWSVAEYLHNQADVKARTLFATHYHELTDLEITLHGVKNYNVSVKEWNDEIIFVRKIVRGGADKSYGIQVARLAGLPKPVIERAKDVLNCLEEGTLHQDDLIRFSPEFSKDDIPHQESKEKNHQLNLFKGSSLLEKEIKKLNLDELTPLEALLKLKEIKDQFKDG